MAENLIIQIMPRPDISQTAWNIQCVGEQGSSVVEAFTSGRVFCWTCCRDDCVHVQEVRKIHLASSRILRGTTQGSAIGLMNTLTTSPGSPRIPAG